MPWELFGANESLDELATSDPIVDDDYVAHIRDWLFELQMLGPDDVPGARTFVSDEEYSIVVHNDSIAGSAVDHGADDDLVALSVRLAGTPMSPLDKRHISPDHELKALVTEAMS